VVDIKQYIKSDNKLDYELLWKNCANITGFQAERKRGVLYYEVTEAYKEYKASSKHTKDGVSSTDVKDEVLHNPNTQVPRSHKITEDFVISYINQEAKSEFIKTEEYCTYDAVESRYVAEIKVRNKHYDTCLIEYDKCLANQGHADIDGKEFLYIVATTTHIYVFNISKIQKSRSKIRWKNEELPRNSHFGGYNDKKTKKVGYIPIGRASVCYNYKT
tara:strand:- start:9647 stop:10297 length:651 start_codon:yes stop_codon:yes gene_type:complete